MYRGCARTDCAGEADERDGKGALRPRRAGVFHICHLQRTSRGGSHGGDGPPGTRGASGAHQVDKGNKIAHGAEHDAETERDKNGAVAEAALPRRREGTSLARPLGVALRRHLPSLLVQRGLRARVPVRGRAEAEEHGGADGLNLEAAPPPEPANEQLQDGRKHHGADPTAGDGDAVGQGAALVELGRREVPESRRRAPRAPGARKPRTHSFTTNTEGAKPREKPKPVTRPKVRKRTGSEAAREPSPIPAPVNAAPRKTAARGPTLPTMRPTNTPEKSMVATAMEDTKEVSARWPSSSMMLESSTPMLYCEPSTTTWARNDAAQTIHPYPPSNSSAGRSII